MIEKEIYTAINDADIAVYPVEAPQEAPLPYVVYRRISTYQTATLMDGEGTIDGGRIQLNCYAVDYGATKAFATAVKAAIQAHFGSKAVKVHESDETDDSENWAWLDYSIWMKK